MIVRHIVLSTSALSCIACSDSAFAVVGSPGFRRLRPGCSPSLLIGVLAAADLLAIFLLVALLVGVLAQLVGHIERGDDLARQAREGGLVGERLPEDDRAGRRPSPRPRAPELDGPAACRGGAVRRSGARARSSATASSSGASLRSVCLARASLIAVLEHRGEIPPCPAWHRAPIASTRACSTASKTARADCPRGGIWHACRRMVGEAQRQGIGEAAGDLDFGPVADRGDSCGRRARLPGGPGCFDAEGDCSSGSCDMVFIVSASARLNGPAGPSRSGATAILMRSFRRATTLAVDSGSSSPKQR